MAWPRLFTDASFLKLYYSAFVDLIDTVYNPQVMNPLIEQTLGGFVPQATRDAIKQYRRRPDGGGAGCRCPARLRSPARCRSSILITRPARRRRRSRARPTSRRPARCWWAASRRTWNARTGAWSIASVPLNPGINRVLVETYSGLAGPARASSKALSTSGTTTAVRRPRSSRIPMGSVWKYLDNGTDQGTAWRAPRLPTAVGPPAPANWVMATATKPRRSALSTRTPVWLAIRRISPLTSATALRFRRGRQRRLPMSISRCCTTTARSSTSTAPRSFAPTKCRERLGDNTIVYNTPLHDVTAENDGQQLHLNSRAASSAARRRECIWPSRFTSRAETSSDISFDLSLTATGIQRHRRHDVSGTLPAGVTDLDGGQRPVQRHGHGRRSGGLDAGDSARHERVSLPPAPADRQRPSWMPWATQYNQIRFTRTPGIAGVWNGVQFANTMQANHISYAVLEWASPTSNNGLVGVSGLAAAHRELDARPRRAPPHSRAELERHYPQQYLHRHFRAGRRAVDRQLQRTHLGRLRASRAGTSSSRAIRSVWPKATTTSSTSTAACAPTATRCCRFSTIRSTAAATTPWTWKGMPTSRATSS